MARVGVAVDGDAARRGRRERARGGRLAARRHAVARGVGRGDRAGQRLPRGEVVLAERGADGRAIASSVMPSGDLTTLLGELLRDSLDHCVKCTICETYCPVSNVTPLFPGPKYAGPQAERFRVAGRAVRRHVGRLLLGLRDLLAGLPAGGEDRRDQRPGAQQAQAPEGRAAARPDHHPPDLAGAPGTPAAPLANWTLRQGRCGSSARRCSGSTATRRCRRSPGGVLGAGRASARARAAAAQGRLLPRLRRRVLRAAAGREGRRDARAQRLRGRRPQAGLLRAAAAVQRPVRRCPQGRAARWRATLAPHVRDDDTIIVGNATSCTLMLKREAREILGLEDDPELKLVSERVYDICELLLELHDRGELKTDFRPVHETVAYHAPCQQQGHGIGKPALDLLALVPGLRGRRDERALLRRRRDVRAQGARSTTSPWRSAPTCSTRSPPRARRRWCATPRPAAGRSRRRPSALGASDRDTCTARTGSS